MDKEIFEKGNLDKLNAKHPERKGWVVGSFITESLVRHADNCETKWVRHLKGEKKHGGTDLSPSVRTLVILISGKCQLHFPSNESVETLQSLGDYIVYEGMEHEFEALEDSLVVVVRWDSSVKAR